VNSISKCIRVDIEAESRDTAATKASQLFDQGDIWRLPGPLITVTLTVSRYAGTVW
jgi:hypothetical protein